MTKTVNDEVLEFLRSFIAGGVNQDFKPWASELYQKLYRASDEPTAPSVINAEGSQVMMELFNRMPIAALKAVPEDIAKRVGDFMVANGYRFVFDRWYLQAEPKEPERSAQNRNGDV